MSRLEKELAVARRAVAQATIACASVQAEMKQNQFIAKQDHSPVTIADFASQAIVCAALQQAFADDPVVGEETTGPLRQTDQTATVEAITGHVRQVLGADVSSKDVLGWIDRGGCDGGRSIARYWTIDPIDGTKGFLRGDQYAIALALIEDGRVVLGALACPKLAIDGGAGGVLMLAADDRPTMSYPIAGDEKTPGKPVNVSRCQTPAGARFCESLESVHTQHDQSTLIAQKLGMTQASLRMDSQAKYAAVAAGQAEIFLRLPTRADYRECIWDHAAGYLCVQQAGGQITDLAGRPLDFSMGRQLSANFGVAATCGPAIHDALLQAVADSGFDVRCGT